MSTSLKKVTKGSIKGCLATGIYATLTGRELTAIKADGQLRGMVNLHLMLQKYYVLIHYKALILPIVFNIATRV